jgi:hypothetical protein
MRRLDLTTASLLSLLHNPVTRDELADSDGVVIVVDLDHGSGEAAGHELPAGLPAVLVGTTGATNSAPLCDVVVQTGRMLDAVLETVAANPQASTALVMLLRQTEGLTVEQALVAESAVYSTLQGGAEFAAWRAASPVRARPADEGPVVRVERTGDELEIVLDRPHVRNAFDTAMRDQLYEALAVAAADPRLRVRLRANGPDFCAGGDLDEFGSVSDPATGHLIRLSRSVGRMMSAVADRVTVELHGACVGAGIEIPAFASRVRARSDTRIALPELRMGLIPGAGGTVSISRRAGRHATAYLALTGTTIDASTALSWGLVDELIG